MLSLCVPFRVNLLPLHGKQGVYKVDRVFFVDDLVSSITNAAPEKVITGGTNCCRRHCDFPPWFLGITTDVAVPHTRPRFYVQLRLRV